MNNHVPECIDGVFLVSGSYKNMAGRLISVWDVVTTEFRVLNYRA
jgi:hypothetical protein